MAEVPQVNDEVSQFGINAAKGGIAFVSGSLARAFMIILLLIVLARVLSHPDFGVYTIIVAFYSVFELTGYFGIGTTLRKKMPEAKNTEEALDLISNAYLISCSVAILIIVLITLFSGYISNNIYNNVTLSLPLQIASLSVLLSAIFNINVSALIGMRKNNQASIAYVSQSASYFLFAVLLVMLGYGIVGAIVGLLIGYTIGMFISFLYLIRSIEFRMIRPTIKSMRELISFSIPIFISNVGLTAVSNFGIIVLGVFTTAVIVGNYGIAFKLGSFADAILTALAAILLTSFAHAHTSERLAGEIELIYNKSIYYTSLFLLPMLAYLISVSYPLIALLFGYGFILAPTYFAVIAIGITATVIGRFAGTLLISYGRVKRFMLYQIEVIVVEIILILALVPLLKTTGLLIALFIFGPIFLDVIYTRALLQQFSFKLHLGRLLRVALASIILGIVLALSTIALYHSRVTVVTNALISLIVYPPLLAKTRGVGEEDIAFLRRVNHRIPIVEPFANRFLDYVGFFLG